MAVTAFKACGTAANGAGSNNWTNLTNISASDDARLSNTNAMTFFSGTPTSELIATNFGFTNSDVPVGSVINGIEVNIERRKQTANTILDNSVKLRNGSASTVGSEHASAVGYSTTDGVYTYGGAADDWSAGLTQADIVNTNFGVITTSKCTAGSSAGHADIDYIEIRVYYTPPAGSVLRNQNQFSTRLRR